MRELLILRRVIAGAFVACLAAGCSDSATPSNSPGASKPPEATGSSEREAVELKTVKYAELAKAFEAQRGKVVVADLWGEF